MQSFSEKVFSIVKKIPRGKVLTYKEVARMAGKKKAWRAVGNILNINPRPIIVPCHRVVCSGGKIGGYKDGVWKKTSLLQKEGVLIKKGRIVLFGKENE